MIKLFSLFWWFGEFLFLPHLNGDNCSSTYFKYYQSGIWFSQIWHLKIWYNMSRFLWEIFKMLYKCNKTKGCSLLVYFCFVFLGFFFFLFFFFFPGGEVAGANQPPVLDKTSSQWIDALMSFTIGMLDIVFLEHPPPPYLLSWLISWTIQPVKLNLKIWLYSHYTLKTFITLCK